MGTQETNNSRVKMVQEPMVDLEKIIAIESGGNPNAYNKGGQARGLGQITPIALQDWNQMNPAQQYTKEQLFDPNVNRQISSWMLQKRIPQMLTAVGVPVTADNIIWAYNSGAGNVKKGVLPTETKNYLAKYQKLLGAK